MLLSVAATLFLPFNLHFDYRSRIAVTDRELDVEMFNLAVKIRGLGPMKALGFFEISRDTLTRYLYYKISNL